MRTRRLQEKPIMKLNSKFEARNTKFETSTNSQIKMSETKHLEFWNLNFGIVSDFEFLSLYLISVIRG